MNESTQKLLALHYVLPRPWNRLAPLLETQHGEEKILTAPVIELSKLLSMSLDNILTLRKSYLHHLKIPFEELYVHKGIIPITIYHPLYPAILKTLIDPPAVLYTKGDPQLLSHKDSIAVIGSRKAGSYSRSAITRLVPPLVKAEYTIISGLAIGADTMAHEACIQFGGRTIAVLGSGFYHPYPKANARLLNSIIEESHLAISEYPPYMEPKRWNFPMRNRIISGLSKAIIVTEAKVKSGTLSTVDHALEHGKDIFAVPGDIFSPLSEGPNNLILEGAKPVWNGFQVLDEYTQATSKD